ncbi:hypothetical protein ACQQ2N_20550 [Dokdonella sp. MW10]|uniref:hypothetical protein n=1 Tax=Dokdonella sp. MW10 TaxID=2992926 RepID=UPI003F82368F
METPPPSHTDAVETSPAVRGRTVAGVPVVALPESLDTLRGADFAAAMPTLERLARGGRADALRVLFGRLDACASHRSETDEEIEAKADDQYRRALSREGIDAATCASRRAEGGVCQAADWRDETLRMARDSGAECAAMSPQQIAARVEWARLAVERGDRAMVTALYGVAQFRMDSIERMRHLDALVPLSRRLREEMDRLVDAGDLDALQRMALGSMSGGVLVDQDPIAAYAAYLVLQRAAPERIASLAGRNAFGQGLTPAQLADAHARAEALYTRCCAR